MDQHGLRILVVDDDRDFASSLADIFRLDGHRPSVAHSGEAAVERLRHERFDATFMDVRLPQRNGVEVYREIRQFAPHARVYLMTGFCDHQLQESALSLGVRDVLQKPLEIERLLALVGLMRSQCVLIADADSPSSAILRKLLDDHGYAAFVAATGAEVLRRLSAGGVDLLILALPLPDMPGLDLHRELLRRELAPPTVVIAADSRTEPAALEYLRLQEIPVLHRPFDPKQLLGAVESLWAR